MRGVVSLALDWKGYHRNKQEVVGRLKRGEYEMITGNGVGLMDRFFAFMRELGFLDLVEEVKGEGYERVMIPVAKLLMAYQSKVLLGIASMNQVPDLLFNEVGILKLIGFTARQIKEGYCERGGGKRPGPFHKDTLADALEKLAPEEVAGLFNETVQLLAQAGFFPRKKLKVILDSSDLETTDQYEGVGKKTVEKRIKDKWGKIQTIEVTVYGWKLIMLQEIQSRMVVAAKVVQINEHESNYTMALIEQGQENLAGSGREIGQVVMDKGFLDGEDLWRLHQQEVHFVVPAKKDMQVTKDAQGFRGQPDDGEYLFYEEQEMKKEGQVVKTKAYGIRELTTYDQYGDEAHRKKNRYAKSFKANPINAVVVTEWEGKSYKRGREPVFLTEMRVGKPLELIREYDDRSDIENLGFRELKQGWLIGKFPKKTKQAVLAHILLTLIIFNLANGFRTGRGYRLGEKGIRRFRREEMGRDSIHKVIVFAGEWYAILDVEELMVILGVPPKTFFRVDPKEVAF